MSSFELLHPDIQRWIWEQKWDSLRPVQDKAIRAVLETKEDVLISAATAAGKTEAAFFPALTRSFSAASGLGVSILYVSPLKALINDQFLRLQDVCNRMQLSLVRWHGDAPQGDKHRLLKRPNGIILITPESIEALFLRRTTDVSKLLGFLQFIVVDELHSFLQGARGLHLFALLQRIDAISQHRPRRIGLSATLGDLSTAAAWLRHERPESVEIVTDSGGSPELRLQTRAYLDTQPEEDSIEEEETIQSSEPRSKRALDLIADHMFKVLRGENNLVFAGSRRRVEALSDRLRRRSEKARVPNEFYPHHGSLSKELREELEHRLKEGKLPTTAVATTTLELGIDIGSVMSVAQVGAPRSMSALRQRLGRSGRRAGNPAILRIYVREPLLTADSDLLDCLRFQVIRTVAAVRLLIEKFVEPPSIDPAVATVVLHQVLSVICQRGGAKADELYALICKGPMGVVNKSDFVFLLRSMASNTLLEQATDRTIMLGELGELITSKHDFYAVFQTEQEWRLVCSGQTLGTIPIVNSVGVGSLLAFAGRRWRINAVDDRSKVLDVVPHRSARIPKFDKLASEALHDRFVAEMRAVYEDSDLPAFLDHSAKELFQGGRSAYRKNRLDITRFFKTQRDTHIFTWRGTSLNSAFAIALAGAGLKCTIHDIGITVSDTDLATTKAIVRQIASTPPDADSMSAFVKNLRNAKYDEYVPEELLRTLWAKSNKEHVMRIGDLARELVG